MRSIRALSAFAGCLFLAPSVIAQAVPGDAALRKQVDGLAAEVKSLRAELDQVRTTLRDLTARMNPSFDITSAPVTGDPKAKVVIVEFTDYQCPFCMEYFSNTYRKLIEKYVATGKVRYVGRDFPGEAVHPQALKAAEAGLCASDQGKFWEMHDALFTNQPRLASTGMTDAARSAGLNLNTFQTCLDSGRNLAVIRKEVEDIARLGVSGTPAFFIGTPDPDSPLKIRLQNALVGAQPLENFEKILDPLTAR